MSFLRKIMRKKAKEMYKREKPVNLKNEKMSFSDYYKDKTTQNKLRGKK